MSTPPLNIHLAHPGGENPPRFKSTDLKTWTLVGDFLRHQPPDVTLGEDISCPNFFRLGDKWMLLCISHPFGCRYYLGDWDAEAEQFVPDHHGRMNWRRDEQPLYGFLNRTDVFAPESVPTPDGRRIMWAWLTTIGPDDTLQKQSILSLPRELSLPADGILRIAPLRELETLRYNHVRLENVVLEHPVTGMFGDVPPTEAPNLQSIIDLEGGALELRIRVSRQEAARKQFGFVLFADAEGHGLPIQLRPETGSLRVGTTDAPFAVADLSADEDIDLRIYIDNQLVEVFANHCQALVAAHGHAPARHTLHAFTVGAPTRIQHIDLWKLHPTNQGFLDARGTRIWEPETA